MDQWNVNVRQVRDGLSKGKVLLCCRGSGLMEHEKIPVGSNVETIRNTIREVIPQLGIEEADLAPLILVAINELRLDIILEGASIVLIMEATASINKSTTIIDIFERAIKDFHRCIRSKIMPIVLIDEHYSHNYRYEEGKGVVRFREDGPEEVRKQCEELGLEVLFGNSNTLKMQLTNALLNCLPQPKQQGDEEALTLHVLA